MEKLCATQNCPVILSDRILKSKSHALFSLLNPRVMKAVFVTPFPAAPVAVFSPFRANCCQSVRGADCAARSHASAAPGQSPDFQPDSPASDLPVAPYPGVLRITPCSVHFPSPLIRAGECVIKFYNLLLPGMEEGFREALFFRLLLFIKHGLKFCLYPVLAADFIQTLCRIHFFLLRNMLRHIPFRVIPAGTGFHGTQIAF